VANSRRAFEAPRLVRSIIKRADDLDSALQRRFPGAAEARDFHERYLAVVAAHRASEPRPLSSGGSLDEQ
jgi:hypothetical protein